MAQVFEYPQFTIRRQTKGGLPNLPFVAVKEAILGKKYELSLLFPNNKLSIELHKQWKQKDDPVNVLAFSIDGTMGEIVITLNKALREAHKFGHRYDQHVLFLFIHGCLHLKGFDHGARMEERERHLMQRFYTPNL